MEGTRLGVICMGLPYRAITRKLAKGGRVPFLVTEATWLHLCLLEQVERFVPGSDSLPFCQCGNDVFYFLLGQMGVPVAAQLATEHF